MLHQFLLASSKSKGFSGRGVRMRVLSSSQRNEIFEQVAVGLGPDATMMKAKVEEGEEGVRTALVAVTKREGIKTSAELLDVDEDGWMPLTNEHLSQVGWEKYFTTKDVAALTAAYRKFHDVSDAEVNDILGEALALAEG